MRRLLPCVACCSLLLAACSPFASAAVLCCPFALPGLLRWLPGWLLPDGVLQQRPCQQQLCHGVHSQQRPAQWRPQASSSLATMAPLPATALSRCPQPAASSRWLFAAAPLPASPLQRPCQQQTSFDGEEYSGLASNLAHLGRIC